MQKLKIVFSIVLLLVISGYSFAQKKKIAYCSNQTASGFLQVFTMNEDGSDKKQISDVSENCMKPRWSPDGKQITFYSDRGFIYLIRNVDDVTTPIKPFLVVDGINPFFMPGGDQIMYNDEYNDVLSIYVIDTAEYNAEAELISDGSYSNMQSLSSSGNKLVYSSFVDGVKTIMIADMNDTTDNYLQTVSLNDEANLEPDISTDETRIVYASFDNNLKGTIRIFENGKETELTKGMPSSNVPRFSPDGKRIAFAVINNSSVDLYIMDSSGGSKKNLNIAGNVGTFQWIDNDRILFDAGSETRMNVGIVDANSGVVKVIADGDFNLQPCIQK